MVAVSHGAVYVLPLMHPSGDLWSRDWGDQRELQGVQGTIHISNYSDTHLPLFSLIGLSFGSHSVQQMAPQVVSESADAVNKSLVILGGREKGWEVSQSLLVILTKHFIGSFAITECYPRRRPELLRPLCFWEMTSPTWLGGCWESIQSRAMEAWRTSSLPEARREHSLGRTFSATISAWISAGVGKNRGQGGSEHCWE